MIKKKRVQKPIAAVVPGERKGRNDIIEETVKLISEYAQKIITREEGEGIIRQRLLFDSMESVRALQNNKLNLVRAYNIDIMSCLVALYTLADKERFDLWRGKPVKEEEEKQTKVVRGQGYEGMDRKR